MEGVNDVSVYISIIGGIIGMVGGLTAAYIAFYKVKPETRQIHANTEKANADTYAALAEAAETITKGAQVSSEVLLSRINELLSTEKERLTEIREIRETSAAKILEMQAQLNAMQKVINRQGVVIQAYQDWAKRLSAQVISLSGTPVLLKLEDEEETK